MATAAVAGLLGMKMSCEEMGALKERLTCRTTRWGNKKYVFLKCITTQARAVCCQLRRTVTLRYICPCPAAVPLSRTDWLIVVVAEAPMGRLLAADPDAVVMLACQVRRRWENYSTP